MALGCTHEEASFVSLDDLDNISIFLDKDNDFEEEITHLFNEVRVFIFNFEKRHNQSSSKYTQNMYCSTGQLRTVSNILSSIATVWFGLQVIFSTNKESMIVSKYFIKLLLLVISFEAKRL